MNIEQLFKQIKQSKPRIIYISGKTSTGKTTFSNKLNQELGYDQIELDEIVMRSVVDKYKLSDHAEAFIVAYRSGGSEEWRQSFVQEAKKEIYQAAKEKHIVIDGAIANVDTLQSVFSDESKDFMFVYLRPSDKQAYIGRINKRFTKGLQNKKFGLPKSFWNLIPQGEKEKCISTGLMTKAIAKAVDKYVDESMEESAERLEAFQNAFSNIIVVDI